MKVCAIIFPSCGVCSCSWLARLFLSSKCKFGNCVTVPRNIQAVEFEIKRTEHRELESKNRDIQLDQELAQAKLKAQEAGGSGSGG